MIFSINMLVLAPKNHGSGCCAFRKEDIPELK